MQPAQVAQRTAVDRHAAGVLHRPHRAHLVGDRADAADPRGDVGRLGEGAAAQQRLEEARRLVDAQLDLRHLAPVEPHVHRALALDAGEVVGAQHRVSVAPRASLTARPPARAARSAARRNGGCVRVEGAVDAHEVHLLAAELGHARAEGTVLGASIGP